MRTSGCIHDGWLVLGKKRDGVDQDYFYRLLGSDTVYAAFSRLAAGATVKNLNIDLVKGVTVPVPPVEEQRRIAAILDQADALRVLRRQALAELDMLAKAVFLELFGDPATNSRNLPLAALGSLGVWSSGGTPPRGNQSYFSGSIPWFSSGELETMYVSEATEHISDKAVQETSAKKVPAGSVMLGMYDTAALKASIAAVECSCNQAIAFCQLNPTLAEATYVYSAIVIGREHFRRLQRGVRQKNLNLSMIREIQIPMPPVSRQRVYTNHLHAIESLKATHRTALAESDALFASLQHRAFAGTL
jgi:type I restriction enzyme, S subunit